MCYSPVSILCRVKMNNALGHIKSYISVLQTNLTHFYGDFKCADCEVEKPGKPLQL